MVAFLVVGSSSRSREKLTCKHKHVSFRHIIRINNRKGPHYICFWSIRPPNLLVSKHKNTTLRYSLTFLMLIFDLKAFI